MDEFSNLFTSLQSNSNFNPKVPPGRKCGCGKIVSNLSYMYCDSCGIEAIRSTMVDAERWVEKEVSWLKGYFACYTGLHKDDIKKESMEIHIDSYITGRDNNFSMSVYGLIDDSRIEYPSNTIEREFRDSFGIEKYWKNNKKYLEEVSNSINRIMRHIEYTFHVKVVSDQTLMLCTTCNELTHGVYSSKRTKIKECEFCTKDRREREAREEAIKAKEKIAMEKEAARLLKFPAGGSVYLLKSPTDAYKIGHAKNPANRLRTFNVKLPFEVQFIRIIKTPNMKAMERKLHKYFSSKRINGEWFKLEPEDIQYIMSIPDEL